MKSHFAMGLRI